MLAMKSTKKVLKPEKRNLKNLLTKTKIEAIIRTNTNVTAGKQNDKYSQNENKGEVRGSKTPKKDIVVIRESMIKYVNGRKISRSNSLKIRSHSGYSLWY